MEALTVGPGNNTNAWTDLGEPILYGELARPQYRMVWREVFGPTSRCVETDLVDFAGAALLFLMNWWGLVGGGEGDGEEEDGETGIGMEWINKYINKL